MPWWGTVIIVVCTAILVPSWWRIRKDFMALRVRVAEIETRLNDYIKSQTHKCQDRGDWIKTVDDNVMALRSEVAGVAKGVARIEGRLQGKD